MEALALSCSSPWPKKAFPFCGGRRVLRLLSCALLNPHSTLTSQRGVVLAKGFVLKDNHIIALLWFRPLSSCLYPPLFPKVRFRLLPIPKATVLSGGGASIAPHAGKALSQPVAFLCPVRSLPGFLPRASSYVAFGTVAHKTPSLPQQLVS